MYSNETFLGGGNQTWQLFIERDKKSTNVPLVHFKSNGHETPSIRKVKGAYLTLIHFKRVRAIYSRKVLCLMFK